jgi:hypothetical protein
VINMHSDVEETLDLSHSLPSLYCMGTCFIRVSWNIFLGLNNQTWIQMSFVNINIILCNQTLITTCTISFAKL